MDEEKNKTEKKVRWETVALTVLILALAYFIIVGLLVSLSGNLAGRIDKNRVVRKTADVVPYPVAMVGSDFISYKKLLSELDSVQRFYENQDFSKAGMRVDFSTTDGRKRLEIKGKGVLGKLIDDEIIQAEAKKRGINLTNDVIDQEVDRKLKEYGTGDSLKSSLEKLYGWNLSDFKEDIVKPDLYREELFAYLQKSDPSYAAAKKKIDSAQKDLQDGMDFSAAAKKYSDGESAKNGGELGWFSANQMLPEVAAAAFKLDAGKQSEIIQSSLGYHIVEVEDKKTENDVPMVKVSQIFVRTKSFPDWLREFEKDYHVVIFSREFRWGKNAQAVEFRSGDMQDYEKKIIADPSNDPSMLF